jgi:hypothetical protein
MQRSPLLRRVAVPVLGFFQCFFAQTSPLPKPAEARSALKPPPVHLEDIAGEVGLRALNVYGGDTRTEFIIETTGNGAIIFDYDNDGWPDIFFPQRFHR